MITSDKLQSTFVISLALPDCFCPFFCGGRKRSSDVHSKYTVVLACHDFHGVLIGKINTTLTYILFVTCTAFL